MFLDGLMSITRRWLLAVVIIAYRTRPLRSNRIAIRTGYAVCVKNSKNRINNRF